MKNITYAFAKKLAEDFNNDQTRVRDQNALVANDIDRLVQNHQKTIELTSSRSAPTVRLDDWDATAQNRSGRCWLFSSLNLLRFDIRKQLGYSEVAKKHNGGLSFELSQAYAMFYDKLERANYFLEDVIELALGDLDETQAYIGASGVNAFFDRGLDGQLTRLAQNIVQTVCDDGGQWNMAVNLYKKYGVVPKSVFPESFASSNTSKMNTLLKRYLRKRASEIVNLIHIGNSPYSDVVRDHKDETISGVWSILATNLGTPPISFAYNWRDENGVHKTFEGTPQEFLETYGTLKLEEYVCLVDDPRKEHPKGQTIGITHLGNVITEDGLLRGGVATAGTSILYLNATIAQMKQATIKALTGGEPVWMGCNTRPFCDRDLGIWSADLYDYDGAFGVEFRTDKETQVRFGESAMTHAMLFTGFALEEHAKHVGLEEHTEHAELEEHAEHAELEEHAEHTNMESADSIQKVKTWRVENSWGSKIADKGFFTMDDSWFDEYMFEVAIHKDLLPNDLREAYENYMRTHTPDIMLPVWDPLGSLAR